MSIIPVRHIFLPTPIHASNRRQDMSKAPTAPHRTRYTGHTAQDGRGFTWRG